MVKRTLILVFLVSGLSRGFSQDPQFSQFYSNYLYLAPSFAGLTDKNRIAFNYRNQWPEIKYGYQTYSVSFDKYVEKFNSGVGVLLYQDVAGSGRLRTTSLGIQYSYDFSITESWHARPGLHFNYTERGIDFERLLWNDQISASGNAPVSAELEPMDIPVFCRGPNGEKLLRKISEMSKIVDVLMAYMNIIRVYTIEQHREQVGRAAASVLGESALSSLVSY